MAKRTRSLLCPRLRLPEPRVLPSVPCDMNDWMEKDRDLLVAFELQAVMI